MKLYYIEKDIFLHTGGKERIAPFVNSAINSMTVRIENAISDYLINCVLKNVYNKENSEIIISDNKSHLKDNSVYFSVTHADNIVIAAFDDAPVGIDAEVKKLRVLKKLRKRYNKDFETLNDFYAFWTQREAVRKLNASAKKVISFDFKKFHKISIASSKDSFDFKLYNISEN